MWKEVSINMKRLNRTELGFFDIVNEDHDSWLTKATNALLTPAYAVCRGRKFHLVTNDKNNPTEVYVGEGFKPGLSKMQRLILAPVALILGIFGLICKGLQVSVDSDYGIKRAFLDRKIQELSAKDSKLELCFNLLATATNDLVTERFKLYSGIIPPGDAKPKQPTPP